MATLTYTEKLYVQSCCTCSIKFAVPADFDEERRTDHKSFWCPAGHSQSYTGKTEAQKLRDRLEAEERKAASLLAQRDQAIAEADHQAAVARGYKGALAKTKKRIGRGVCPCCNRHFADVERHMASKHPELVDGGTKHE